jgi:hypothetical protein
MRLKAGLVGIAFLLYPWQQPVAAHEHRDRWCRYETQNDKPGWSRHEVYLTIRCATRVFDFSLDTALNIAYRESRLNERATNPSSGACGVYQHLPEYWPGRRDAFNHARPNWNAAPSCYNARSNVLVSVRMMANGGLSHWVS